MMAQRLSMEQLHQWEALKYGMFIHYGMSTYVNAELPDGKAPKEVFAPTALDARQWVRVAKEAGMKYAVLTTKHVAGHCLWPTKTTDYCTERDIVGEFVAACRKEGILPGFYYCMWDNHNLFGSETPNSGASNWNDCFTTPAFWDFVAAQLEELATRYGEIAEFWLDIPKMLPRAIRQQLYDRLAALQPNAILLYNHGIGDGEKLDVNYAWPTDVITIERFLPVSGFRGMRDREIEGRRYYIPGEVCEPIGREWFYVDGDRLRPDEELLGMLLTSVARGANLLLDVPPDRSGRIPDAAADALRRVRALAEKIGFEL